MADLLSFLIWWSCFSLPLGPLPSCMDGKSRLHVRLCFHGFLLSFLIWLSRFRLPRRVTEPLFADPPSRSSLFSWRPPFTFE